MKLGGISHVSQGHLLSGSSDAAFRCQYISTLLGLNFYCFGSLSLELVKLGTSKFEQLCGMQFTRFQLIKSRA